MRELKTWLYISGSQLLLLVIGQARLDTTAACIYWGGFALAINFVARSLWGVRAAAALGEKP